MSVWQAYIEDVTSGYRRQKEMAEKAIDQLADAEFFRRPGEHSNSVAVIVKHLAGNLLSRWTDFLASDGDKPWRDRDDEFVLGPEDTRERLLDGWRRGWDALFGTLAGLGEGDLLRVVTIRGEGHTVMQALSRGLVHAAYHAGQVLYVARLVKEGEWAYITIPPGQSRQYKASGPKYLR
jgi:hypothetical protein